MDRSLDSASLTSIDTIPSPKILPKNMKPQQKPTEQNSTELELDVIDVLKEPHKKEENEESDNKQWVKIIKKMIQFFKRMIHSK